MLHLGKHRHTYLWILLPIAILKNAFVSISERYYALKVKGYQTYDFLNPMIWDTNLGTQPEFLAQLFSSYNHCTGKMYDLQVALL